MPSRIPLKDFVADELSRRSNELADEWVDHIEHADRSTSTNEELVGELREQIPNLVRSIVAP